MNKQKSAFTLVELMAVIVIIAILATIASPIFDTYISRSKLSKGLSILNDLKIKVSDYYNSNSQFPNNLTEIDANLLASTYSDTNIRVLEMNATGCSSAGTLGGQFCVYLRYFNTVTGIGNDNGTLILSASIEDSGFITWSCCTDVVGASASIPAAILPSGCVQPAS